MKNVKESKGFTPILSHEGSLGFWAWHKFTTVFCKKIHIYILSIYNWFCKKIQLSSKWNGVFALTQK